MRSKNSILNFVWEPIPIGVAALACFALGVYIAYLAIDMVGIFGRSMGIDLKGQRIYARTHVAVHLFSTLASVLVVVFKNSRNYLLAGLALGAVALCGTYSISNMIGFTSTNRVSVAAAKGATKYAEERDYQMLRRNKQDAIKWAESTLVTVDTPRERKRLEGELARLRAELDAIKAPKATADNVYADPQATLLAKLTGWAADDWQMVLAIAPAVLTYVAEVLCFIFGTHLLVVFISKMRGSDPVTRDAHVNPAVMGEEAQRGPREAGQVTHVTRPSPIVASHYGPAPAGQPNQDAHPDPGRMGQVTQGGPREAGHTTHVTQPSSTVAGQPPREAQSGPAAAGQLTQVQRSQALMGQMTQDGPVEAHPDPTGQTSEAQALREAHPDPAPAGQMTQDAQLSHARTGQMTQSETSHMTRMTQPNPASTGQVPPDPRDPLQPSRGGSPFSGAQSGNRGSSDPEREPSEPARGGPHGSSGRMGLEQAMHLLHEVASKEPRVSTRQLARHTQWPRRTLDRLRLRVEGPSWRR